MSFPSVMLNRRNYIHHQSRDSFTHTQKREETAYFLSWMHKTQVRKEIQDIVEKQLNTQTYIIQPVTATQARETSAINFGQTPLLQRRIKDT